MIDINLIRQKPEWVKEQIAKLNDTAPIDEILVADKRRREILQEVEELRADGFVGVDDVVILVGELEQRASRRPLVRCGQVLAGG